MNNERSEILEIKKTPLQKMNFKISFSQHMKLILSLIAFGICSAKIQAQQTQVIVEYGAPEGLASLIQGSSEDYLNAINRWQFEGIDVFHNHPGTESLKALVEEYDLVSTFDTLGTSLLFFEDQIELPRIFLKPKGGSQYSHIELILTFSITGELTQARLGDQNFNFDRIQNRSIEVTDKEIKSELLELLAFYEAVFNNKSLDSLQALFGRDALIISGREASYFEGFEFRRNTRDSYVERMRDRVFLPSNKIEVELEDAVFFRHPDKRGVYGVIAHQKWNTTAYSDTGYIFLIVDTNGKSPKIVARKWQPNPFEVLRFSSPEPDPLATTIRLEEIKVDAFSKIFEGSIELSVNAPNKDVFNAYLVQEWLNDGILSFGDINTDYSTLEVVDSTYLRFDFDVTEEYEIQKTESRVVLQETSNLKGFNKPLELYLNRVNRLRLTAYEQGEEELQFGSLNLMASLTIETNTDSVQMKVMTVRNQLLKEFFQPAYNSQLELVTGDYRLHFMKEGFHDLIEELHLQAGADTLLSVQLQEAPRKPINVFEIPLQETPVNSNKSFFAKNKYWLIGGAAAIVTSTVLIMSNSGDQGPGIPVPPGRPGFN